MANKNFKVKNNVQVSDLNTAGAVTVDANGVLQSSSALPVAQGGTGQTTAQNAINALVPSQTSNANKLLGTDGTSVSWVSPGIAYQTSAPLNPVTGQLWVDSDETGDSLDPYIIRRKTITATAGQTVFTTDVTFTDGYEQVYYNGVLLVRTTDYTTSGGTNTVTLLQGASAGDTVEIIASTPINAVNSAILVGGNNFTGPQTITSTQNGNNFIINAPGGSTPNFTIQGAGEQTFRFYNTNTTGTTRTSWKMASRINSDWSYIWYTDSSANGTNDLTLANLSLHPIIRIAENGNFGVATTSPNTQFEVKSSSKAVDSFGTAFISSNDFGVDKGGSISLGGVFTSDNNQTNIGPYVQISGRKENSTSGNYAGYMAFATRINGGAVTERMRIPSNGGLLINKTTNQYGDLDVYGSIHISGNLNGNTTGYADGLTISQNSINGAADISYFHGNPAFASNGGHRFLQKTGASTARSLMYMRGDGNIGIGTDTPGYKLDVIGNISSTGYYGPMLGGNNLATIANNTVFSANVDTKIADLSPLSNGLYALFVNWGYGDNNAGGQLYWNTSFGGIVGITSSGQGAYFNGSPANQVTMSATQHHRNASTLPTFWLKSDSTNGAYGNLSLYIRFPEITRIDIFTVIAKRFY